MLRESTVWRECHACKERNIEDENNFYLITHKIYVVVVAVFGEACAFLRFECNFCRILQTYLRGIWAFGIRWYILSVHDVFPEHAFLCYADIVMVMLQWW